MKPAEFSQSQINTGEAEKKKVLSFKETFSAYVELTKPRLTLLSVFTTLLGFYLGSSYPMGLGQTLHVFVASFLVGGGANALNQFFERELDAKMKRTMNRPLPSSRLNEEQAFNFGVFLSVVGIMDFLIFVNPLTAVIAALILISYLIFYTPLKQKTPVSTLVGAIPGALPPVMGWTAARGEWTAEAWALFGILFFWQMPHFLAIAWVCREDYAKAGFPFLAVADEKGWKSFFQITVYCLILLPVSLLPTLLHMTGKTYFFAAAVLSLIFLGFGLSRPFLEPRVYARRFFLSSIVYLSLLIIVMMIDKVY